MAESAIAAAAPQRFSKMHGAGNDFVVLDLRGGQPQPDAALCRHFADRHLGVGCDQILTIEDPLSEGAVASYRIWNSDGSASQQCGNGARCIAAWLVRDGAAGESSFAVDSPAGRHAVWPLGEGYYRIDMGRPEFDPARIPLRGYSTRQDQYVLDVHDTVIGFGAVSMGNPHAVIEVDDVDAAPVETIGPMLQSSAEFPESANVGFAQVIAPDRIRLRVYERGVGETLACGSGACAAAAVLMQRGRIQREVAVQLPGGELRIVWPDDDSTLSMSGPTAFVFEGEWNR
ncbi:MULTISPECIES: diaminopimelate epimerase [Lysobacter]|uniref:Diaminopimelate epimerase n=1 Tax=Lysobacter gummosus TaxID=262324 RepID=A0ABY3XDP1_9GAMM|nr:MULTISPECIES: diaminopimelate epimerase [Lysobacter]ALN93416.1 diaminopimelate epimerase [Lysobacter gummosus]UJB19878.1 diaminopimelate epimerase [Lysobacter capsici]UJQ26396.1 diaminopimelate epimerase [Lysobacter gummosus]UNP28881.1 diaminopimelate epimerase [Lysobacter gummosus]